MEEILSLGEIAVYAVATLGVVAILFSYVYVFAQLFCKPLNHKKPNMDSNVTQEDFQMTDTTTHIELSLITSEIDISRT